MVVLMCDPSNQEHEEDQVVTRPQREWVCLQSLFGRKCRELARPTITGRDCLIARIQQQIKESTEGASDEVLE